MKKILDLEEFSEQIRALDEIKSMANMVLILVDLPKLPKKQFNGYILLTLLLLKKTMVQL